MFSGLRLFLCPCGFFAFCGRPVKIYLLFALKYTIFAELKAGLP